MSLKFNPITGQFERKSASSGAAAATGLLALKRRIAASISVAEEQTQVMRNPILETDVEIDLEADAEVFLL